MNWLVLISFIVLDHNDLPQWYNSTNEACLCVSMAKICRTGRFVGWGKKMPQASFLSCRHFCRVTPTVLPTFRPPVLAKFCHHKLCWWQNLRTPTILPSLWWSNRNDRIHSYKRSNCTDVYVQVDIMYDLLYVYAQYHNNKSIISTYASVQLVSFQSYVRAKSTNMYVEFNQSWDWMY